MRGHLSEGRALESGSFAILKRGNDDFAGKLLNREARLSACREQLHGVSVGVILGSSRRGFTYPLQGRLHITNSAHTK
jgi:hypothetical protein